MGLRLFLLLGLVVCIQARPVAAAPATGPGDLPADAGAFPLTQIHGDRYPGNPQVWSAAQDARSVLYFADAHQDGILEFDGATWRRIPVPAGSRALGQDDQGRVYVGGPDDLGYLEPSSLEPGTLELGRWGEARFVSLLDTVAPEDREFSEVAFIVSTPRGVFFVALQKLLRWHEGRMDVWSSSGDHVYYRLYPIHDRIYVAQWQRGLLRFEQEPSGEEVLRLAPGGEFFADMEINAMFPAADGKAWIITEAHGTFLYDPEGLADELAGDQRARPLATTPPDVLDSFPVQHGTRLGDGSVILVSPSAAALWLDGQGRLLRRLERDDGLEIGALYFALADRLGGVWLTGEDGIARWEVGSPLTVFRNREGLPGRALTMLRHDGRLLVGASQGLAALVPSGPLPGADDRRGRAARLRRIDGAPAEVWTLVPDGEAVLLASSEGVYRVGPAGTETLSREISMRLLRPARAPDRLLAGDWNGVATFAQVEGQWTFQGYVEGLDGIYSWLEEDVAGRIWVSAQGGSETAALELDDDTGEASLLWRLEHAETPRVVRVLGGRVRAWTPAGFLRLDEQAFEARSAAGGDPFVPDPDLAALPVAMPAASALVAEGAAGELWLAAEDGLAVLERREDGSYASRWPQPRRMPAARHLMLYADPLHAGVLWLGGFDGLFRFDTTGEAPWGEVPPALLRRVMHLGAGSADSAAPVEESVASGLPVLPSTRNSVRFEFAAPATAAWNPVEYQVRLDGFEDRWSQWSPETRKEYTNLPAGHFEFRVRTRSPAGDSAAAVYPFRILPPWYLTWWALCGYVLAVILLIHSLAAWRSRKVERERRYLSDVVEARTEDLRREKEEVERINRLLQEENLQRRLAEEERRKLEEKILQVQKLESLGVLAGGVAHDFNNLLVGILGNADLAQIALPRDSPAQERLADIEKASRRAADLCQQMLAYSGKGRFMISQVDLNEIAEDSRQLLLLSIPKNVELAMHLGEPAPSCEGDASQLRQVIMNLILNAAESIGKRQGLVSITTGVEALDAGRLAGAYFSAAEAGGDFAYMVIEDNGEGMDEETVQKIFDPFFTTKFTGRGLGLAAVLGIVRSHRGAIEVGSRPGAGTAFRVLLPAVQAVRPGLPETAQTRKPALGGRLLLVDDEEVVRSVASRMLHQSGFEVVCASNGMEAVEIFRERGNQLDGVILDLTMPQMDGEQTFRALRELRGDVPVLLSSGFSEEDVSLRFAGASRIRFIQKPYDSLQLLGKVLETLGTAA